MPSNYSTIGFRMPPSFEEFKELALRLKGEASPVPSSVGGSYWQYRTPQGSELWIQLSPGGELNGCAPHFAGPSRFRLVVERLIPDDRNPLDGRLYGTMAAADGHGCPLAVDVPDFRNGADRLGPPVEVTLQIAAFARQFSAFDSLEEYRRSPAGAMADVSLIPSGTFEPGGDLIEPPQAEAILSGRVEGWERLENPVSGSEFYALAVRTLGGPMDVVVDPQLVEHEPVVGGVIAAVCWLSGRLAGAPAEQPRPRPWWRRFLGG